MAYKCEICGGITEGTEKDAVVCKYCGNSLTHKLSKQNDEVDLYIIKNHCMAGNYSAGSLECKKLLDEGKNGSLLLFYSAFTKHMAPAIKNSTQLINYLSCEKGADSKLCEEVVTTILKTQQQENILNSLTNFVKISNVSASLKEFYIGLINTDKTKKPAEPINSVKEQNFRQPAQAGISNGKVEALVFVSIMSLVLFGVQIFINSIYVGRIISLIIVAIAGLIIITFLASKTNKLSKKLTEKADNNKNWVNIKKLKAANNLFVMCFWLAIVNVIASFI